MTAKHASARHISRSTWRTLRSSSAIFVAAVASVSLLPRLAAADEWYQQGSGQFTWGSGINWGWASGAPYSYGSLADFVDYAISGHTLAGPQQITAYNNISPVTIGPVNASAMYVGGAGQTQTFINTPSGAGGIYCPTIVVFGNDASNSSAESQIQVPISSSEGGANSNQNSALLIESRGYATSGSTATTGSIKFSNGISYAGGINVPSNLNLIVEGTTVDLATTAAVGGSVVLQDGGVLNIRSGGSLVSPVAAPVSFGDSTGFLDLIGTSLSLSSVAGSGAIGINSGGVLTMPGTSTFTGRFTGNGELVASGGTLTLTGNSAANTSLYSAFSGPISLTNGTISVSSGNNLGTASVYLGSNAVLAITASTSLGQNVYLDNTATIAAAAGTSVIFGGAINDDASSQIVFGSLTATGIIELTQANSASRGSYICGGTVQFANDVELGASGSGIALGQATLELLPGFAVTNSRSVVIESGSGTIAVDTGAVLSLNGVVSDTYAGGGGGTRSNLIVSGTGTGLLVLSGTNTYSGGTTINGNLSVNSDANLGATGTAITFGTHALQVGLYAAGNLITTQSFSTNRPMTLGSYGAQFSPAAGTVLTLNGVIGPSTSGGVYANGPGTLVLTGANTFGGGVTLNGGTAQISSDGNLGSYTFGSANGGIAFYGGTLETSTIGTTYRPVTIATNVVAGINPDNGTAFTFAGPISGAGSISVTGSGRIGLNAANTYSGGTTITHATVFAGPVPPGSATGPLGTGAVTLGTGGGLTLNGGQLAANSQQSIAVSGYNQDIIVEKSASPNGYQSAVSTSFDDYPYTNAGYVLYEQGYVGPGNTTGGSSGLPTGGALVSSSGNHFQLQPYNANNVLLVNNGSGGTLTLTTQGAFQNVRILATAVDGAVNGDMYTYFTDGTSLTTPLTLPDWYNGSGTGYQVNGRLSLSTGAFEFSSAGYPNLYELDVLLPFADQTKLISSFSFTTPALGGNLGVFAISGFGQLVSSTQNYTNNVVVTGESNINLNGSPTSTMGTLTLGPTTLYVFGPTNYTLTFANTVISGATNLSANGPTVNLGVVTGNGSLTTYGTVTATSLPPVTLLQIQNSLMVPPHSSLTPFVLQTGILSIAGIANGWTGRLDLSNNAAIITNGDLATVTNQVESGYAGGAWNGTGITSSSAAANTAHLTALGVILNKNSSGGALYSTFDGVSAPLNSVLVSYTYFGDTNLSGTVDGSDYSRLDSGYLTQASGWYNGDFNYDGVIDGSDYTLIDNAYNTQGSNLAAQIAASTAEIAGGASVPEPATFGLLATSAASLLSRRRRMKAPHRA